MVTAATETRTELISAIHSHSGAQEGIISRIFAHVATADLAERDPTYLGGAAAHLIDLAGSRGGETAIAVFTPTAATHGWSAPRTVVQVATTDSPFLVDSVTEAIATHGHRVHLNIHPIIPAEVAGGGQPESWMHIEISRLPDDDAHQRLAAALAKVLGDVAKAVADWPAMRTRALELATAPVPAAVPARERELAGEFLTWLVGDHFTFLGYREYSLVELADAGLGLRAVAGTGLGILREDSTNVSQLRPEAQATAHEPRLLTITKANSRSTVHRDVYLDYIGIRAFDEAGNVTGEHRFLGLFTTSIDAEPITELPIVSAKVAEVFERSGHSPQSHTGKDLKRVLERMPREELFQDSARNLTRVAQEVVRLEERRASHLFTREDEFGRFVSVLVYIPRDRYNTTVRLKVADFLREAYGAEQVDFTTNVSDSPLAQVHLVLRMAPDRMLPHVDLAALHEQLDRAVRTWQDQLNEALAQAHGEETGAELRAEFAGAFSPAYQDFVSPTHAVADIDLLKSITGPEDVRVRLRPGKPWRFKVASHEEFLLTDIMPVLMAFGVKVVDERPFAITLANGQRRHISDFGLELADDVPECAFEEGFRAVWLAAAESDGLNALITRAGLPWQQVVILRTLGRYAHQIGPASSFAYVEAALTANPQIAAGIVDLFETRFNPHRPGSDEERASDTAQRAAALREALAGVRSADDDRILRLLIAIVEATSRTNYYVGVAHARFEPGSSPAFPISLKLDPAAVPGMPKPHPMAEIWVYSPEVEGVHLRFSPVARGGLRWSDRYEDFRTEVLGLVKAQTVKNSVIVPGGSKGGFVGKRLPSPADRGAWLEAGKEAYRAFVRAMLDITDNRLGVDVVPPADVVCYDGEDPYLVVAADKGTAAFSDVANEISREYAFWLDDAFASGGSEGYDHKGMGITARGAWESAKRHFRELGIDIQTEEFTVVGIGDMSGDVFGNGMRRSRTTRLIAAFDHRHVFIDPDPDPEVSFEERERLYHLPGSSWADYDPALISAGGGVFERAAKSVSLTPEIRAALGLGEEVAELTPAELIQAALRAPVDLIYNGGIGTSIKASSESHADIGDPAGDSVRVDAADLRARVIVEGGNLGVSQRGRVEAARGGIAINTDAIDNSGGVTTSDKEVNLKILFTGLISTGALTMAERNALLAEMTEEVAEQVLTTNYEQNVLLSNTMRTAAQMLPVHQRVIQWLEERGDLQRALEDLPDDAELEARRAEGRGLTQPELAVVVAYVKLALKAELTDTDFAADPFLNQTLTEYFPTPVRERFGAELLTHPLRENLIINEVANSMVNVGGVTFAYRAMDETGASVRSISRAYVAAREIFGLREFASAVAALDNQVPASVQSDLYLLFRRALDRAVRWLVTHRPAFDLSEAISRYTPVFAEVAAELPELLVGDELAEYHRLRFSFEDAGVDSDLAGRGAGLLALVRLLDVIAVAEAHGAPVRDVAHLYFRAGDMVGFTPLMAKIRALPQGDRWTSLARSSLREDLYAVLADLTAVIARDHGRNLGDIDLAGWFSAGGEEGRRALASLRGALAVDEPDLAVLSVAVRKFRTVVDRRRGD